MKRSFLACPYCSSELGYYQIQHVKRHMQYGWVGRFLSHEKTKVFYSGKKLRCIKCDEIVTSYVKGLEMESDNA